MKKCLLLSCSFILLLAASVTQGHGKAQSPVNVLMRLKLDSAQNTLEGLAIEDFDMVARNAKRLRLLSQETGWNVLQTKAYRDYSHDFRRATEKMILAAKQKNVDAVGLAYIDLTFTCIDCHKHVRAQRMAE